MQIVCHHVQNNGRDESLIARPGGQEGRGEVPSARGGDGAELLPVAGQERGRPAAKPHQSGRQNRTVRDPSHGGVSYGLCINEYTMITIVLLFQLRRHIWARAIRKSDTGTH